MKGKFWVLAVIGLVVVLIVAYSIYFAPLKSWDNYKPANIGKEIRLHGTIVYVYQIYQMRGSSPYGGHEVSKFKYVLGEEYICGTSRSAGFSRHAILDMLTQDISPIEFYGGSGPVDVTGIIRQAPAEYSDYFEIYLEVTKIELDHPERPATCVTLGDDTYKAVAIGRNYLENILSREGPSPWVGDLLQVQLEIRDPNYYWHYLSGEEVDKPDVENTLCWVITFEKAKRPGHFFEVWIDADSEDVVGGMQCR